MPHCGDSRSVGHAALSHPLLARPVSTPGPAALAALPRVGATLLLALHALLAWTLRVPGLTTGHDDAWYLSLARALRLGSYGELPIVGTPTHAMYPPLYPMLLALFGIDRPGDIALGVALNIALSVLALGLAALLAARIAPRYAVAMLVVCAPNPLLLERASSISSEPLFMVATFLALLLLTVANARTRTLAWGGSAVIAATLSRSIGVALLLAILIHWLVERRWRRVGALLVAGALTSGAWLLWTVRAPRLDAGRSYIADVMYTRVAPTVPTATSSGGSAVPVSATVAPSALRVLAKRVQRNVPAYIAREIPSAVAVPTIRDTAVDNALWAALLLGGGIIGLLALCRTIRFPALYVAVYLGVLAVWPYVLGRFLAPVLPLLVLVVFVGLAWLVERVAGGRMAGGHAARAIVGAVAVLMAIGALRRDAAAVSSISTCDREAPATSAGCFADEQRDFFAAATLARQVTPDSARFLSSKEATLYLLSGRQSVRESRALTISDPAAFAQLLQRERVGYLLLSRLHLDQQSLAGLLAARCRDYVVVRSFGLHVVLLRVRAPQDMPGRAAPDGCAAIDRWARGDWES